MDTVGSAPLRGALFPKNNLTQHMSVVGYTSLCIESYKSMQNYATIDFSFDKRIKVQSHGAAYGISAYGVKELGQSQVLRSFSLLQHKFYADLCSVPAFTKFSPPNPNQIKMKKMQTDNFLVSIIHDK